MSKQITEQRLYHIALHYLSKYDAGTEKVRRMLMRRVLNDTRQNDTPPPAAVPIWIQAVLDKLARLGYINDETYAANRMRRLSESGKSLRFIRQKLAQEGVDTALINQAAARSPASETDRAARLVRRKKMGYLRPAGQQAAFFQKDLAALARAGFSYAVARQVLNIPDGNAPSDIDFSQIETEEADV